MIDKESDGLSDLLFKTIQSAEIDLRPELYKHIVLSGGTTMYPGLPSRLEKDIKALYLKNVLKGDTSRLSVHIYTPSFFYFNYYLYYIIITLNLIFLSVEI